MKLITSLSSVSALYLSPLSAASIFLTLLTADILRSAGMKLVTSLV
jgi:hypothetical protein